MSTIKKDGIRTSTSSTRQKTGTISKTKTLREKSTDRINNKKEEAQLVKTKSSSRTKTTSKISKGDGTDKKLSTKNTAQNETPRSVRTSSRSKPSDTKSKTTNPSISSKVPRRPQDVATPPSNRITKTTYFPSKNIYTNALPEQTLKKIRKSESSAIKDEEKKTQRHPSARRTSVSSEQVSIREFIKEKRQEKQQDYHEISSGASSLSERPGTATLTKGKIVNKNIVGPEAPGSAKMKVIRRKSSTIRKDEKKADNANSLKAKSSKLIIPEDPKIKKSAEKVQSQTQQEKEDKLMPETSSARQLSLKLDSSDDYKYEDDFESYESDFEPYTPSSSSPDNLSDISGEISTSSTSSQELPHRTSPREIASPPKRTGSASTDDEKKLDSGTFEMPEYKHKQRLYNIRESIERENAKLVEPPRTNPASLSDEGFEEAKSLQFNFIEAQKRYKQRKSAELRRKRGEELLNMMSLDAVYYTIFDLPPVPYEEYIKNYGSGNSVQISTQTGEDNLHEEVQTETIDKCSIWTQMPSKFSNILYEDTPKFWWSYKCDYLGVGNENAKEHKENPNENYVEKFILSAGKLMLDVLTESTEVTLQNIQKNDRDIPFSDGYISFNTSFIDALHHSPVRSLSFCRNNSFKILTAHGLIDSIKDSESPPRSLVCSWNISNESEPEFVYTVFGDVSCCSYGLDDPRLVFAGLSDGTVVVWDSKESSHLHKGVSETVYHDICFRTPTFRTEVGLSHNSKVLRIQSLSGLSNDEKYFEDVSAKEICTLEEDGNIIVWSVIEKYRNSTREATSSNQGLAHWGSIVIVKNIVIALQELYSDLIDLQCTDFVINNLDPNHIYVATNYGYLLHCLVTGGKTGSKKFAPDELTKASCIESCPFSPLYFMSGCDNGTVNIYARHTARPLITLSNKDGESETCPIDLVKWSHDNPFLLYSIDAKNIIHVWDLCQSDLYPIYSIPFRERITCMALSPTVRNSLDVKKQTYLAIASEDGNVHLHILNQDHSIKSEELYNENLKKFLNYASRL